jgi:biotin synthase-related radical SAM superfamily protein
MLGVAAGTAGALGLMNLRLDARPTAAHLMIPGRCRFGCHYCTQAGYNDRSDFLSRMRWPPFEDEVVLNAISGKPALFERICVQATQTMGWMQQAIHVIGNLRATKLPISLSCRPLPADVAAELLLSGADRIGLPLDVASPRLYRRLRGGVFEGDMRLIEGAGRRFPGRISSHIIVGLGEREDELVDALIRLHRSGVLIALFAFTPCPGTKMATRAPPALAKYRRAQVARHLIERGFCGGFGFNSQGDIRDFGCSWQELRRLIGPSAFRTSGCPGCNRPFYNERPSGPIYNYPEPIPREKFEEELRLIVGM